MVWYQLLLIALIVAASGSSVYYSFRQRREREPVAKGLFASSMNVSMGVLLLFLSIMQASLFKMSSLRLVMATVFALLGLFNLFAGLKNRSYFQSLRK